MNENDQLKSTIEDLKVGMHLVAFLAYSMLRFYFVPSDRNQSDLNMLVLYSGAEYVMPINGS